MKTLTIRMSSPSCQLAMHTLSLPVLLLLLAHA